MHCIAVCWSAQMDLLQTFEWNGSRRQSAEREREREKWREIQSHTLTGMPKWKTMHSTKPQNSFNIIVKRVRREKHTKSISYFVVKLTINDGKVVDKRLTRLYCNDRHVFVSALLLLYFFIITIIILFPLLSYITLNVCNWKLIRS